MIGSQYISLIVDETDTPHNILRGTYIHTTMKGILVCIASIVFAARAFFFPMKRATKRIYIGMRSKIKISNETVDNLKTQVFTADVKNEVVNSAYQALLSEMLVTIVHSQTSGNDDILADTLHGVVLETMSRAAKPLINKLVSTTTTMQSAENDTTVSPMPNCHTNKRLRYKPLTELMISDLDLSNYSTSLFLKLPSESATLDQCECIEDTTLVSGGDGDQTKLPDQADSGARKNLILFAKYFILPIVSHSIAHSAPSTGVHHAADSIRHLLEHWDILGIHFKFPLK